MRQYRKTLPNKLVSAEAPQEVSFHKNLHQQELDTLLTKETALPALLISSLLVS